MGKKGSEKVRGEEGRKGEDWTQVGTKLTRQ